MFCWNRFKKNYKTYCDKWSLNDLCLTSRRVFCAAKTNAIMRTLAYTTHAHSLSLTMYTYTKIIIEQGFKSAKSIKNKASIPSLRRLQCEIIPRFPFDSKWNELLSDGLLRMKLFSKPWYSRRSSMISPRRGNLGWGKIGKNRRELKSKSWI